MDLAKQSQHATVHISVIATGALVALLAIAILYFTPFTYIYCLAAQDAWLAAKTERELDGHIRVFQVVKRRPSNQAMRLTVNEPAVYAFRLAHHASMLRFMHKGLGAADLLCR